MAYTLNNFKNSLNTKIAEAAAVASIAADKSAQAAGKTTVVVKQTGEVIRRALPVSTRRFENYAEEFNNSITDVDKQAHHARVDVAVIAHALSIKLPSEEEKNELYEDMIKQLASEERADKESLVEERMKERKERKDAVAENIKNLFTKKKKESVEDILESIMGQLDNEINEEDEKAMLDALADSIADIDKKVNKTKAPKETVVEEIVVEETVVEEIAVEEIAVEETVVEETVVEEPTQEKSAEKEELIEVKEPKVKGTKRRLKWIPNYGKGDKEEA